jgi:hypothetical protein
MFLQKMKLVHNHEMRKVLISSLSNFLADIVIVARNYVLLAFIS